MFTNKPRSCRPWLTAPVVALLAAPLMAALAATPVAAQQSGTARELLDGYVNEALRENLSLAQQREALRRADAGMREANGRLLPSLGLNARYSEFSGVVNIVEEVAAVFALAVNHLAAGAPDGFSMSAHEPVNLFGR